MEVQQIIVFILFAIAAGSVGWRIWKTFSKNNDGGCAKGCGCAADKMQTVKVNK